MERGAKSAKAKVEGRPTVARKPRRADSSTTLQFNDRLAEAMEQHAAISEILQVICASPSDVQPVLDAVAERAARLCRAPLARVMLVDGEVLRAAAEYSLERTSQPRTNPTQFKRTSIAGRAVLDRATVHHGDVVPLLDSEYPAALNARRLGVRAVLAVPLMREATAYGAIFLWRREPGLFSQDQVALVETFARQAAIAIDNVRLFKETREALEQQTATSEILRVISRSQTDVQPVFDTIAQAAHKLCRARTANVFTYDGEMARLVSVANANPQYIEILREFFPRPASRDTAVLRAILTRTVVAIPDVLEDKEYVLGTHATAGGFRSVLAVPLMREGNAIGGIAVGRAEPGPFPDAQVALLQTFADQAVIAIENVRLFNETKEALERQTATAEILKVISRSPTDTQPIFDAIVQSAWRLCDALHCAALRLENGLIHMVAHHNWSGEGLAMAQRLFPMRPEQDHVSARVIREARLLHLSHMQSDPAVPASSRELAIAQGYQTLLVVPMLRERRAIGAIVVAKTEGPFSDKQVTLLQTFADQAVIAIENVRLFTELNSRTAQLTRSVGELEALGEVGQAVSSTLDLETVLSTIVSRATELAGMDGGSIWEYDEEDERFYLHATDRLPDELVEVLRATPVRKGEGALGRLALTGEPVEIRDITDEGSYQSRVREKLIRCGYRSVLAVPLLREDRLLGALAVNRNSPGEFAPEVIALLKTFATQSALAIQNARLFREIEEKSRELAAASRHKSEFLANMSHELRTPLNAIIGFSEVLSERMFGEINDKQAEYIRDILESGRHLLSLINDILDLSKIEAGRMELEAADFDLPTAIENTLVLVRERAHRRGITLGRSVDERLGKIRADERKVKQVLLNLLSNALKFTPERGRIDIEAVVRNGLAEISVTDTGVGIAPQDQAAVFEEFRQVGTAAKKIEGTGLGLAISKKFIELHGGTLSVRSELGAGATFTFTLPLTLAAPPHVATRSMVPHSDGSA
jgi:signal transduction histidine kinase